MEGFRFQPITMNSSKRRFLQFTALLLLGNNPGNRDGIKGVLSQGADGDSSVCNATTKPSVAQTEYIVGCTSIHDPLLNYLTDRVGSKFDPPLRFFRNYSGDFLIEEETPHFDFFVANPHLASCVETETGAVSLATQIADNEWNGTSYNISTYGAVLYTLKNRTDIRSVEDVKGKKLGTNKITLLATHLCYDILLQNGVHHLQDPEQTIFFKNSKMAVAAILRGEVDVGCASTGTLETYIDEEWQQPLDLSQIHVLNEQSYQIRNEETGGMMDFPFRISSALVPAFPFLASTNVDIRVKQLVQKELLAIRNHADVAPALIGCLEAKGCNETDLDCLQECFPGPGRNCDTTPQLALEAYKALDGRLVGFSEPLQNFRIRDIQESTGFLVKHGGRPRCVRLQENIVDAVTCPPGHFARTNQEIIQECNVSGLPCFDNPCICSPCVEAFEVDFFSWQDTTEGSNYSIDLVGSGCSEFSVCGTVEQEHVISFRAIDNKARVNAVMTGSWLLRDESELPFEFEKINGTFVYDFVARGITVGQKTLKIRINGKEIPESPFRIIVEKRNCPRDTGDPRREADDYGHCLCQTGTVEISHQCVSLAALIPCIVVFVLVLFLIPVYFYVRHKREQADNIWKIKPSELHFDDPPRVLGHGSFGLVLMAEYRGTAVAVKRVLPPEHSAHAVPMPSQIEFKWRSLTAGSKHRGPKHDVVKQAVDIGEVPPPNKRSGGRTGMSSMSMSIVSKNRSSEQSGIAENFRQAGVRVPGWRVKRTSARQRERFVEEIRLLSRLRHPNITTVMGAVISKQWEPMLVMEYMHFGSLHDLLHNESVLLEEADLIGILHDVASGLRFLHSSEVLHGDLKSHNILVDDKMRAKVADFGCGEYRILSMFSPSRSGSKSKDFKKVQRGTPFWMAPELLNGTSGNTQASDVYAFGIVIYEVFSRKEPYEDDSYDETLRLVASQDVNKRPPVPENCPTEAAKMMKACLKYDPSQRPTAMGLDICLRWMDGGSGGKTSEFMTTSPSIKSRGAEVSWHADDFLDQMFPHNMADALREGRKVEPEAHDEVTIVFSAVVDYREIVSDMSANKVSDLLERLHHTFDELCERFEVFPVDTVGEAQYMGVTNLDKRQPHHASLAAKFAVEAVIMASLVPIDQDNEHAGYVQLRVGLHSGPVISHVIGTKTPRFTLIGDTVNIAADMERSSKPGQVQCSEDCYQLLTTEAENGEFRLEERGLTHVKGKGDLLTYWIAPALDRIEHC